MISNESVQSKGYATERWHTLKPKRKTHRHMDSTIEASAILNICRAAAYPSLDMHKVFSKLCPLYRVMLSDNHLFFQHIFSWRYLRHRLARISPSVTWEGWKVESGEKLSSWCISHTQVRNGLKLERENLCKSPISLLRRRMKKKAAYMCN